MELAIGKNYTHEELEDELTRAQGFSREKMSVLLSLEMIQNMQDEVIEEVNKLAGENDWLFKRYIKLIKRTEESKRVVGNIATLLVSDAKYVTQEEN